MTSHTDSVEGRREVRLSADVDRRLARRVDAIAKSTSATRAEVIRHALRKLSQRKTPQRLQPREWSVRSKNFSSSV